MVQAKNKTAKILDGNTLAEKIKLELTQKIQEAGKSPSLAAILIGDDAASQMYINLKEKACLKTGIYFHKYLCNSQCYDDISETELLELIGFLNKDHGTDGIIVQLPLPAEFNTEKIIQAIDPAKDVDGFHPENVDDIIPPTIAAIIELLKATEEKLDDKKTLIIGKSEVFLSGIEKYLKRELNIKTIQSEKTIIKNSDQFDIVIIALGEAKSLKQKNVKEGAIVIDVGINKIENKTVGDVDASVAKNAAWLSPVPGGVGPLTVACLLKNTFILSQKK